MKYSVIIPFRDRHEHLSILVPALRALGVDMEIIVVEQHDTDALRRGALRNEGARIATGDILVLHDVDYIPTANTTYWNTLDGDVYRAVRRVEFVNMDGTPRSENDTPAGYRTFKDGIDDNFYGGVLCIKRNAFYKINGYNPMYEGWGLEDDDFRERIRRSGLTVMDGDGTFKALPHPDSFKNDELFRRNQQLFANRDTLSLVGLCNTTVKVVENNDKARQYGVDKWLEVTNWVVSNVATPITVTPPTIATIDYGHFAILNGAASDHVQRKILRGERWEPAVLALCEKYIKPNTMVVDIGSNIGTFTVRMSQLVGEQGMVRAFEPQRIIYQQLCCNLFLNNCRNVYAEQVAIGNGKQDTVCLTPINYDNGSPGEVRVSGDSGEVVLCLSLDSILLDNVSLIKIDVERYEPFVFDGAQKTIAKNRPVILFELTTLPLPDYPPNYVVDMLHSLKYNIYQISDDGDYIGLPIEKDDNV